VKLTRISWWHWVIVYCDYVMLLIFYIVMKGISMMLMMKNHSMKWMILK